MARTLGWGVLGATGIADRRTIPEGILPARNARLVAVQSRDPGRAKRVARKYGCPATYLRDEDLLADPAIEAVYIATPVDRHREQTLAAARAGKHVLVEKPMGLTVREAGQMVEACRKARVALGVGFMMRFHPAHEGIRRWIRAGRLGVPVLGRAQLTCWYPPIPGAWRQDPRRGGGGAVMDLAAHCVDLLSFFLGPVRSVSAEVGSLVHRYRSDDTAAVLLRFADGAAGFVDCTFNVPDAAGEYVLELYGSRGCVKTSHTIGQGAPGEVRACLPGEGGAYDPRQGGAGGFRKAEFPRRNVYRAEIEAFSNAVLRGRRPPVPGEDGLENQRVLEAVYRAARTGRRVVL